MTRPAGGCATRWWRRRSAACRCRCSSTASAPRRAKAGFFQPLVDAKARFCRFVPRWGRRYLLRNHQKLALADGRKAIVGGFNISNDYFGTIEDGRLARSRARGRRAERRLPGPLFRRAVRLGRDARRLDPAAAADPVPEQRARRPAPLAVRRADAAAQPLGALGQERPDAGDAASTSSPPISRRACR